MGFATAMNLKREEEIKARDDIEGDRTIRYKVKRVDSYRELIVNGWQKGYSGDVDETIQG